MLENYCAISQQYPQLHIILNTGPESVNMQYIRFSSQSFENISMTYRLSTDQTALILAMFSTALQNSSNALLALNSTTNCKVAERYVIDYN